MAVKRLKEGAFATVQAGAEGTRVKALILTAKGRQACDTYHHTVWAIEKDWEAAFGRPVVNLRSSLEDLAGECLPGQSRLFAGLEAYPDGCRASVPRREVLPHYPMILHRGGFPDGS